MVNQTEILASMQFPHMFGNTINTSDSPREIITWQYAGTNRPADLPTGTNYSGWTSFSPPEKIAFEAILADVETFLNVQFVEVTGSADPDLNVAKVALPGPTVGVGGNATVTRGDEITTWDGFVVFDNTVDLSVEAQANLILHEIGHALGLKHPFSAPALPGNEDNNKYTAMAYSRNPDNGAFADTMMLYDVYALQDFWGSVAYQGTDTVYTGSRNDAVDAVWDTGGIDTFDASARANAVRLDLREGNFSTFDSYPDVVVTFGTLIENATGGAGDDTIFGNNLANDLRGSNGSDTIAGGGQADQIRGGKGEDVLKGQTGRDKLWGGAGNDLLWGQKQNDNLKGGGGRDILNGGKGNDTLNGQKGNDRLFGNEGADRFVFGKNGDKDRIRDFENNVDEIKFVGLGTVAQILDIAEYKNGNVVFNFGGGDILTVLNSTLAEVGDDILV